MSLFPQYLAYTFHSARAVHNYLAGVHTLHILTKVSPPDLKDVEIRLTIRGLEKRMAKPVKWAQLLTPEILLDILTTLDLSTRSDLTFWGILVVGFFAMLRKSNLVSDSIDSFDPLKQLTRGHIEFREQIATLHVTWAKNIQNRETVLEIPLFPIPNSPLCPITVLKALLAPSGKDHFPLFREGRYACWTYNCFQWKLSKALTQTGYKAKAFSSHSIRRGSTSWAYRNGVKDSLIQVHGGWASDAYKNYLQFPIEIRAVVALKMRQGILKEKN